MTRLKGLTLRNLPLSLPRMREIVASKLYQSLLVLLYPLVLVRLWWRGRREPAYRERIGERIGRVPPPVRATPGALWFHTVSAGETISAAPLIAEFAARHPQQGVLVTTMTPTGSSQVRQRLPQVAHCYAPYDFPWAVNRFFDAVQPCMLVLMETELWPNLIAGACQRNVPVLLINARLSARSAAGYGKISALAAPMFRQLDWVACQESEHQARFVELGVPTDRLSVTGSVKFDKALPADAAVSVAARKQHWHLTDRWCWIGASTHPGEDAILLAAHEQLLKTDPTAVLLLVPRHPVRGPAVQQLAQTLGLRVRLQSEWQAPTATDQPQVIVADSMGELQMLYGLAQAAFIGGSLVDVGGHDPIEAALCELPLAMGPQRYNFGQVCERFVAVAALSSVQDSATLSRWLIDCQQQPEQAQAQGQRAAQVIAENAGARQALLELLSVRFATLR